MAENFFVTLFERGSVEPASHPSATCSVDDGYKLIGGGAVIDPVEPSNFLTASYPLNPKTWYAAGKDHEIISPALITVYAIGLFDPDDIWGVQIVSDTSPVPRSQPKWAVGLTDDYVLSGGGAIVHYTGAGNMLNASYPSTNPDGGAPDDWYVWNAHSKDHDISDPANITVYAIGIRLRGAPAGSPGVRNIITSATSRATNKPEVSLGPEVPIGSERSGGGVWDEWSGAGNMLTASAPLSSSAWYARGSDHITESPAPLTAWAIFLEPVGASQPARHVARRKIGETTFPYKSHHPPRRT